MAENRHYALLMAVAVAWCGGCGLIAYRIYRSSVAEDSTSSTTGLFPRPASRPVTGDASDERSALNFSTLFAKRFVEPPPVAPPVVEKTTPAPKPSVVEPPIRIDAELVGTLADDDAEVSLAWIRIRHKVEQYSTGDIIEGHAGRPRVIRIGDGRVWISFGRQEEILSLESNYSSEALAADLFEEI